MSIVNKIIRKLKAGAWFPFYNFFYEHLSLKQKVVLAESRGGDALEGNIFYLLRELQKTPYKDYRLVLSVKKSAREKVLQKLHFYRMDGIKLVNTGSIRYYYYLATVGYLMNDTTFPGRFVKKEGQVYLNTWHGTPLKKMGRDNEEEVYSMGNVMRNLLQSDYLVFPNPYMQQKMSQAYMLDNLYQGTVLQEGYPRNSVFFDTEGAIKLKGELGEAGKQLIFYMPTYRGQVDRMTEADQIEFLRQALMELDEKLTDDQQMLVKLHPLMKRTLNLDGYRHIKSAPAAYDSYEVLNACDVLITDYSSIMYDYICSEKKIILYTYDWADYEKSRGLYEDVTNYPFYQTNTVAGIVDALQQKKKTYSKEFMQHYAAYDHPQAAKRICRRVFLQEKCCQEYHYQGNGKKNILVYGGDFEKNGITSALLGMLNGIDLTKHNYYISFRRNSLEKDPTRLKQLPEGCNVFPIASEMNMDILTMFAQAFYLKTGVNCGWIGRRISRAYQREWTKHFAGAKLNHVVHYNGYERYIIALLQQFSGLKSIWVHNDMKAEIRQKGNQNIYQLRDAYRAYDHVVVVSPDMLTVTSEISGRNENLMVIENCHNYHQVLERGMQAFVFDEDTQANRSHDEIEAILQTDAEKFINIGRFSVEKGHARLLEAFAEYWEEEKDAYLIIIGGAGELYEATLKLAAESVAADHIIVIRSMSNPMSVLKQCNLFLLSSYHEGLPIVLFEAASLNVPIVACDVKGPSEFVRNYGGTLVANSTEGILDGMKKFHRGEVECMHVDFEEWNKRSVQKCEELFAE